MHRLFSLVLLFWWFSCKMVTYNSNMMCLSFVCLLGELLEETWGRGWTSKGDQGINSLMGKMKEYFECKVLSKKKKKKKKKKNLVTLTSERERSTCLSLYGKICTNRQQNLQLERDVLWKPLNPGLQRISSHPSQKWAFLPVLPHRPTYIVQGLFIQWRKSFYMHKLLCM